MIIEQFPLFSPEIVTTPKCYIVRFKQPLSQSCFLVSTEYEEYHKTTLAQLDSKYSCSLTLHKYASANNGQWITVLAVSSNRRQRHSTKGFQGIYRNNIHFQYITLNKFH